MMKNKKLFAILTLVCFMFTLMPVAAMASEGETAETDVAVASITRNNATTTYSSLQAAINAAEDGDTITVLKEITFTSNNSGYSDGVYTDGVRYNGDASFTVNFNGHTVTDDGCVNDYLIYVNNKGEKANEITFTNGTLVSKNGCWSCVCVGATTSLQKTTLNLEKMNIINSNGTSYNGNDAVRIRGSVSVATTLNVNRDTKIISNGASYGASCATSGAVLNINKGATVQLNCSCASGGNHTCAAVGGKGIMNIYAGAEIISDVYGIHTMTTGTPVVNVYGGIITAPTALKSSTNGGNGELATINVYGGTINGKLETYTANGIINISGGTFADLATAIKYATNGATVTLLKSTTGSGVVINKDVTIDFAGHTYTIVGKKADGLVGSAGTETLGLQILQGNNVELKNGTLQTATDECKMLVQNYANLTLTDITLDGTGSANMLYVLSNNSGTVALNGATSINTTGRTVAFDVCEYSTYQAPIVTVNTTGSIIGAIEVTESIKDNLIIKAGTFTATPSAYVVTGSCLSTSGSMYVVATAHTSATAVQENKVDATYSAPGSYDSVVYCTVCDAELSRTTVTIPQSELPYIPPVDIPASGGSSPSTPKVETETVVTPSGTKVETTTETTVGGTKVETVTTTTASGETSTTVTATLQNGSAVTNTDAKVEVEVEKVSYATMNKAEEAVKADEAVTVVGTVNNGVSVSATNAATGVAQTSFAQPMAVSVPVNNSVLNKVEDTSKLTLAKVVTNADGTTSLEYMGGSYDKATDTFNAKVDEDGDYILVEKADLVKIELNIGETDILHNEAATKMEVAPEVNEDNRTMLQLSYIADALGCQTFWDEATRTVAVVKGDITLKMVIDELIPGFDTKAVIKNGRTLVPAGYISGMLGANVIWDPAAQQVIIVK